MIVVACLLTVTIAVSACQATGTGGDGSRPAFLPETDFAWKAVFTAKGPVTSIAAGGPEAVWASDKLGRIYFFNGSTWRTPFTAHDFNNNNIGGSSSGVIYFYNGSTFSKQFEANEVPTGVSADGANSAWAVGDKGGVYFFDGRRWSKKRSGAWRGFPADSVYGR